MTDVTADAPPPGRSKRWLALAGILVALLGAAFVIRSMAASWGETRDVLRNAEVGWVLASLPVALAGMTWVGLSWRRALVMLGVHAPLRDVLRWYFPGQMGKYIPGGVWAVVGRGELAVRAGVARTPAYASVGLSLATTYLAAALLAAITFFPALAQVADSDPPLWVLGLLPVGVAFLHPRVLDRIVVLGERAFGRAVEVRVPPWKDTVLLVALHLPAWLLISGATWLVARAFDPSPPVAVILFATPVSWVVGFIVVGAPGGLGVREATFAAILAGAVPPGVAPAVAIVARVVFMGVDTLGAVLVSASRGREPASSVT